MTSEPFPRSNNEVPPAAATGMRLENDGDRSELFIGERNKLVDEVNAWLGSLAAARDNGQTVQVHTARGTLETPFVDTPRRVTTLLGRVSGTGLNAMATETSSGIWLGGDGVTQPYQLQALIPGSQSGVLKYLEVTGTDPTAALVHGDQYSSQRSAETVVKVAVGYDDGMGHQQEQHYTVNGSGSVGHMTRGVDGVSRGQQIRDQAGLTLFRQTFVEEVTATLEVR